MKLIKSFEQWCDEALNLLKGSEYCLISSFNLNYQEALNDKVYDILKIASKKPHRILIGISTSQCTPNCQHCIINNTIKYQNVDRLRSITNKYRIVQELHMKSFITSNGVIIGGMNITKSDWTDRCVVFNDKNMITEMANDFKIVYNTAKSYEIPQYINPETHFLRGKYKGQAIEDIKLKDPQYITWLKDNAPQLLTINQ
jgi:hypothetical protein